MDDRVIILHNPQCSKSRAALEYLNSLGIEPKVVEYLKTPLNVEKLRKLIKMLGIAPSSLIRPSDFKRLDLTPTSDYDELLQMIEDHPVIMERPIIIVKDKARIGKPIENLYSLFAE